MMPRIASSAIDDELVEEIAADLREYIKKALQ
jgi:hypothetical protein